MSGPVQLPQATIDALRFVQATTDLDVSLMPKFFFAGPQRTGSTWLYRQFEPHPEVLLSDPKEIYFFNTVGKGVHHHQNVSDDLGWYLEHFRRPKKYLERRQWECRQNFGVDFAPKTRGEATASYAAGLDPDRLRDVVTLIPDLRVVVTMRHPIDRGWSHAKLDLCRERDRAVADTPVQEFLDYFDDGWHVRCGMYTEMRDRFEAQLQEGNFLLCSFDAIREHPLETLREVARFLDVDDDPRFFEVDPGKGKNPSESSDMPDAVREKLEAIYADEIAQLNSEFALGW